VPQTSGKAREIGEGKAAENERGNGREEGSKTYSMCRV